jgi:hypothetical protein
MNRFEKSYPEFRFVIRLAALALCCCAIAPGHATGLSVRANDPAVIESWSEEFDSLAGSLSQNALAKQTAHAAASVAANPQSLLFPSDRTPLDVVLRRTGALLDDIRKMPHAPDMAGFERRLNDLMAKRSSLAKSAAAGTASQRGLFMQAALLRRSIAFVNPIVDFDSLVFVRWTSHYHHIQEGWGNSMMYGGGLFMLSGLKSGQVQIRNLLTNVTFTNGQFSGRKILDFKGAVRSFDLSYDARRIVFAWTHRTFDNSPTTYPNYPWPNPADSCKLRICVMNMDGTDLKCLTNGAYDDLDPIWLPNGRILFVSGRDELNVRCNTGPSTPQCVMYSMKDDGSDVTRLSYHETNERYPCVDNDGRLIYTRWDYIDRDSRAAQHLWHCYVDGRDPRSYHGNYPEPNFCFWNLPDGRAGRPFAEYFMRPIPGSQKIAAIASAHHLPPYGLPIIIDLAVKDDNKMAQVKVLTPGGLPLPTEMCAYNSRVLYNQTINFTDVKKEYNYFEPYPLSETYFLIPWGTNTGAQVGPVMGSFSEGKTNVTMGLYLLDAMGNRELVNDCSSQGLGGNYLNIRPYRQRTAPPNIPTQTFDGERAGLPDHKRATISILNVRIADIPIPSNVVIKKMRIVQVFPRHWNEPNIENPRTAWSQGGICRASMGTVPVESDGSVYCEAPVNKGLLFQLLDSNGCAVATMRSLTYVHPGEKLSCTGCHEDKWQAVPPGPAPIAFKRSPSPLTKEPGSQVPMTFGMVAPIFQNTCLACHKSQNKGLQDFTYNDPATIALYPDTSDKTKLVNYCWWYDAANSGSGMGPYGGYRSYPLKYGFAFTRLGRTLLLTHRTRVADSVMAKVKLWVDLNCMRYGNPTHNQADINAQFSGTGNFTWPTEISQSNPTGVELDRQPPGSTEIIAEWKNRGLVFGHDAPQHRVIRFTQGNRCEIAGIQGPARVSVIDVAGRTLWGRTFTSWNKDEVNGFSIGSIAGRRASAIIFVNVTAGTEKQTERYVLLGNR